MSSDILEIEVDSELCVTDVASVAAVPWKPRALRAASVAGSNLNATETGAGAALSQCSLAGMATSFAVSGLPEARSRDARRGCDDARHRGWCVVRRSCETSMPTRRRGDRGVSKHGRSAVSALASRASSSVALTSWTLMAARLVSIPWFSSAAAAGATAVMYHKKNRASKNVVRTKQDHPFGSPFVSVRPYTALAEGMRFNYREVDAAVVIMEEY